MSRFTQENLQFWRCIIFRNTEGLCVVKSLIVTAPAGSYRFVVNAGPRSKIHKTNLSQKSFHNVMFVLCLE